MSVTIHTRPGAVSVDAAPTGSYRHLGTRWDRRDWLIAKHAEHKTRIETVTQVVNGNWYVVWPDLSQTPEAPTVANLVELGVNHWSSIGGAILPSIQVPIHATQDRAQGRRGARKRERRVRELWDCSNMSEASSLLWGDYAGTGSAIAGVWADFEEKDLSKRNPYLMRYDPRHTYPMKDNLGNITELLVARKISKVELRSMFDGEWREMFKDCSDEDVEEWFWYDKDRFFYAIVDVSKDGRQKNRNLVLVDTENKLGFVPFWEAVRPSFDGQRRGVFDQTVHILRTMHRLMTMTIYSSEEHAFPAIMEYDVLNAGDFGPGAILHARSAEARLDRVQSASHLDVKDLIARLGEEAGNAAVFPRQLQGDPGASIVSARGINASMGALDARLAVAHKQFEVLFSKVSGFLLAMDEKYCDGDKYITGDYTDNQDAESFKPSRDIAGAWRVKCTYGIGAGSDPANVEMRLNMNLGSGLISRETARNQLPFLEDPEAEPVKQLREAMQDALITGVLALSQQGDPTAAAKALKLLQKDDVQYDDVVEELVELLAPPEPPAGAGGAGGMMGGGEAAALGAESLSRGGIPGNAENAPLPPLADLLGGGGAPQVA